MKQDGEDLQFKNYNTWVKGNTLKFAISGISEQIAALASQNNNWHLLEEIENINDLEIEITNGFTSDVALTEEVQR